MRLDQFKNKVEALKELQSMFGTFDRQGSYADRAALHFATEEVADCFYGCEKGNEIFMAYPSAFIASQYFFQGQLSEASGGYWNDQWVWANEERGIDLNAAIVFIPKDARVDPETGSRYAIKEGGGDINQKNIETVKRFLELHKNDLFIDGALKILGRSRFDLFKESIADTDEIRQLRIKIGQTGNELGITDTRVLQAIFDYQSLFSMNVYRDDELRIEAEISHTLRSYGVYLKEAATTISSQEYWEQYWTKHPDEKPNKIVYYEGDDPTKAVDDWKNDNFIKRYKPKPSEHMGFPEHQIGFTSPQANVGSERFRSLAKKAINDYFDSQSSV